MGKKQSKIRNDFDFEIRVYNKLIAQGVITEICYDRYQDNDVKLVINPEILPQYEDIFKINLRLSLKCLDKLVQPSDMIPQIWLNKFKEEGKVFRSIRTTPFLSIRRLVSKKKKRLQFDGFDLDLSYITLRTIAMGFPSVKFESTYRNTREDTINYFHKYHPNSVKIYNLCQEKERDYNPEDFKIHGISVAKFPYFDHNPCSLKMLLEFCADVCIFLARGEKNIAAIHCKAGKGRTGLMICGYLLFSEMVPDADEAMELYAVRRTSNLKGLTIPSQRRFLKYFETFLEQKIQRPFFSLIPEIIKNPDEFLDNHFPLSHRKRVKAISLGPLCSPAQIFFQITNLEKQLIYKVSRTTATLYERVSTSGKKSYYYDIHLHNEVEIKNEVNFSFQVKGKKFGMWLHSEFLREVDILSIEREGNTQNSIDGTQFIVNDKTKNLVSFIESSAPHELTQSCEVGAMVVQEGQVDNISGLTQQKRFANEIYKSQEIHEKEIPRNKLKKNEDEEEKMADDKGIVLREIKKIEENQRKLKEIRLKDHPDNSKSVPVERMSTSRRRQPFLAAKDIESPYKNILYELTKKQVNGLYFEDVRALDLDKGKKLVGSKTVTPEFSVKIIGYEV